MPASAPPSSPPAAPPSGPWPVGRHPQGVLELMPSPQQTLASFIAGDNAELVARLGDRSPQAGGERFVYLWGPPAAGRSHLLRAAVALCDGRYMDLRAPDAPLGIELLVDDAGKAVSRVALDNVDVLDAGGQQRLFNLYNTVRYERAHCMLLVSGAQPPAALPLRADLITRLSWGLTYEVHPLTDAQKLSAMSAHAQARGVRVEPEVLDHLLHTVPRDLPTLLAVIDALDRHSLASRRAITLPLAREWLRSLT